MGILAQEALRLDSVPSTKEEKNRNVMLNASSDNQPRQISIGIPQNFSSDIFEDGLPVSFCYWPDMVTTTWRDGASMSANTLMSMSETALKFGSMNYMVSSKSRMASETFKGIGNYTFNHHGKQLLDINLSGPIAKGWGYSLSTYQDFDPKSNHLDVLPLQERMQIYKVGLNKRFADGRGEMGLLYQYANLKSYSEGNGLFYYNGEDGSVDKYDDFVLGKSQYFPDLTHLEYMSMRDGSIHNDNLDDALTTKNHQLTFMLDYKFKNGNNLSVRSKYKDGADVKNIFFFVVGLFPVDATGGYTYRDGTPYVGTVQNRYLMHHDAFERSFMTTAELSGQSPEKRHDWRLGLNEWYNRAGIITSTAMYQQEAKANPKALLKNGRIGSDYNTGSEYYNGHENKVAFYASDDWNISQRLWISAGARLEWQHSGGKGVFAYKADGTLFEEQNIHNENFSINKGKVNRYGDDWINPSATFNMRYTILRGMGLTGEYVYVRQRTNMQDYAGPYLPLEDAINIHMARGGVYWNNKFLQLTSQLFFITRNNYKSRERFTNPDDQRETVVLPIVNDVATFGWTTDVVLTPFKGFQFHGLLTLQDPKYKNFTFQPIFSTGAGTKYDFNNNTVTGMSKMILELDPSYQTDQWRFWLSFRYQSKQYINRTNSLYFKGRWETFAGVDYKLNDKVKFALNLVNLLGQKGASGSISAADLTTDVRDYQHHYLMSGSFIRPFTVELTTTIQF